jgi:RimJ/RimL family protein N-acetyltransferase
MKHLLLSDGRKAMIREAVKSDAKNFIEYLNRIAAETNYLTFEDFTIRVEEEEKMIEKMSKSDNELFLVAELAGKIVGSLVFHGGERPRTSHVGEFGVTVLKEYWHLGIGKGLILFLLKWAKESKVIRKINLIVRADNIIAIKLYRELGFKKEGITTRYFCINNKFYDGFYMGMELD